MANEDSSRETRQISPDPIGRSLRRLNRKIRIRNVVASTAGFIVIAGAVWYLFLFQTLMERIGSLLTALGAAYLVSEIYLNHRQTKASLASAKETAGTNSIEIYRTELVRQRNFHNGIWFWSRLLIFTPGPLIFTIGFAIAHPALARISRIDAIAFLVLVVVAIPLNLRWARKYQCQIDELDKLLRGTEQAHPDRSIIL